MIWSAEIRDDEEDSAEFWVKIEPGESCPGARALARQLARRAALRRGKNGLEAPNNYGFGVSGGG